MTPVRTLKFLRRHYHKLKQWRNENATQTYVKLYSGVFSIFVFFKSIFLFLRSLSIVNIGLYVQNRTHSVLRNLIYLVKKVTKQLISAPLLKVLVDYFLSWLCSCLRISARDYTLVELFIKKTEQVIKCLKHRTLCSDKSLIYYFHNNLNQCLWLGHLATVWTSISQIKLVSEFTTWHHVFTMTSLIQEAVGLPYTTCKSEKIVWY